MTLEKMGILSKIGKGSNNEREKKKMDDSQTGCSRHCGRKYQYGSGTCQ